MSDRNDLVSLILGGLIVYLFLYFTGKIMGTIPATSEKLVQPNAPAHPCGCGGSSEATVPTSTENDYYTGRYIYSAPIVNGILPDSSN